MNPIAAVIAIGVIATLAIVMLGAVQTARTRAMTRKRLGEAIPETSDVHALGTVTHQAPAERLRQASGQFKLDEPGPATPSPDA